MASQKPDEQFFSQFNHVQLYKKNEIILRPNEEPKEVYFLKKGYVRLYLLAQTGQEITFNIFKPGTYFSMIGAIGNLPNFYFFEALTDVTLFGAPHGELIKFIKNNPRFLFSLTKRAFIGLDGIVRLTQSLLTGKAPERVASILLVLARRFGKKMSNGNLVINLPLTHRILASLAGMTRETTSLELEKLKKKNIIAHVDHLFVIQNLKKIEEESSMTLVEKPIEQPF